MSRLERIWSNYSDLTRPHPKWWFSKGIPLISRKSRLVKYYNLARRIRSNGIFLEGTKKKKLPKRISSHWFLVRSCEYSRWWQLKHVFFNPMPGEIIQFDERAYFSKGLVETTQLECSLGKLKGDQPFTKKPKCW